MSRAFVFWMHTQVLETTKLPESDLPPLRIQAIGGCMTQGYPIAEESCFINLIAREGIAGRAVRLYRLSLPGFTCVRAEKWSLVKAAQHEAVNYTVLQFGSTDASLPLREKLPFPTKTRAYPSSPKKTSSKLSEPATPPLTPEVANFSSYLKWWVESVLRWALRIRPRVETDLYANTMSRLVARLGTKTVPVVISPFVMGDICSQASARKHTKALASVLAPMPGVLFVNAFEALCAHPRHRVLLSDGMHLNAFGHEIVAKGVSEAIAAHARQLVIIGS